MITGYNIFGFDFDYISKRVEKFGIMNKFNNLGRINGYHDDMDKHYSKKCKLVKKNLSSSALGDNELKYYNMDGRVLFDVVKEIQKGHNLESYKLDNVASHFMRGKIYDDWHMTKIKDKKLWHIKTNTIGHLKSGDYITINIHSNIGHND